MTDPTALCDAVHPQDVNLPDPIPEEWHTYRRVCVLPAEHPPLADGLGAHASAQGDRWDDPEPAPEPERPNLPAPLGRVTVDGVVLDVDAMRVAAPLVRQQLVDALRASATQFRKARGTVVVEEDTYDLVRRVTAAEEVLNSWASAFIAAAKEARAIAEEEALTVAGAESDGVLLSSLFVPDGRGQRIAVRADWQTGSSTWDVPSLVGWLIDDEAADLSATLQATPKLGPTVDDAREVARNVVARLIGLDGVEGLGKFTPGAKPIENLRKRLAEAGRDADAAVIRQVRQVGARTYKGVTVTREEVK